MEAWEGTAPGAIRPGLMGRSRSTGDQVDTEVLEEGVCFPLVTYTDVCQSLSKPAHG